MIGPFKNLLTVDIGVDMGTTRTRIYQRGKDVVLDEPSYIAVSYREGEPVSAGKEAYRIFGRTPPHVEVHRPLVHGVIDNFDLAEEMLKKFLDQIFKRKALLGARICMVVPTGITDVEKKAFEDIAVQVGGREVYLIEAPIAAAIGMNLPIQSEGGLVSLYMGGSTTQAVLFTDGDILFTHYEPVGGDTLTEAIVSGIRKNHKILIGTHTAEQLKLNMGSAYPTEKDETREIYGKSVEDGLPRAVFVSNWEIREMMKAPLEQIVNSIKAVLERIPPELAQDIKKSGLYITGGNSLVKGLPKLVEHITGLKCKSAKKGQLSCIMGAREIIENPVRYRAYTVSSHSRQFNG